MDWTWIAIWSVSGFAAGWVGAMIYYRRLCSFADAVRLFWTHRPGRRGSG